MSKNPIPEEKIIQFFDELIEREKSVHLPLKRLHIQVLEAHCFMKELVLDLRQKVKSSGLYHLDFILTDVELDRKDFQGWQFGLERGRWKALITFKLPSKVRLVGPFREGETEGPCARIEMEPTALYGALGELLESFLRSAFDPEKKYRKL